MDNGALNTTSGPERNTAFTKTTLAASQRA
jgi:hypothetical protein